MSISRYSRLEERKQRKRLMFATVGVFAFIMFFAVFGFKILVGFSLLVDTLRGSSPAVSVSQTLILPPTLDSLPAATNSAMLKVNGTGQAGLTVILYLNDEEIKKTTVNKNGSFSSQLTALKEGTNTVSAKLIDDKGSMSDLSNVVTTIIKKSLPVLEITSPQDHANISGDNNVITITGKAEDDAAVTVNGRVVVLQTDESFQYQYPLSDGENKLIIKATDLAGNTTTEERTVTYHK